MQSVTQQNFGLLIAYILPGFVAMYGISYLSDTIHTWLLASPDHAPTIGGFLYATIASVGAGLVVSTLRWLIIDSIHHHTGVARTNWNLTQLGNRVAAFTTMIEIHYRYYQFYGGMEIALLIAFPARWAAMGFRWLELVLLLAMQALFFVASRDALQKYYSRVTAVLTAS